MLPRLINKHAGRIETPTLFFSELGNLHDAKIQLIDWNLVQGEIAFELDDLYSNFVGLSEYEGIQPVRLILRNIFKFEIDATPNKYPIRILDFEVEEDVYDSNVRVFVNMGSSGFIRITCDSIAGFPK